MSEQIKLVDQFGNLNIHILQDLVLPIRGGSTIPDVSSLVLIFYIPERGIRHVLGPHPVESTWKQIDISSEDLKEVRSGDSFVLMDETTDAQPLWEGVVKRRGET